jgi:sphingomyelin phosphodiesterase
MPFFSPTGHTHVDQFEISYSNYTSRSYATASAVSYIAPSLTPQSGHPSFRIYTVDPSTFAVLDATTYYADMSNPAYQTTGPVWTPYYSTKATYGPLVTPPLTDAAAELTPAFWHNVTLALEAEPSAFAAYYARKSRGWDVAPCNGTCESEEICGMRAGRSENNCVVVKAGVNFKKRGLEEGSGGTTAAGGHGGHSGEECGLSITGEVLGLMARDRGTLEAFVEKARR